MNARSLAPIAIATLASVVACIVTGSGRADENSAAVYVTKIPAGYRNWRLISLAHEEGNLHSTGAVLGNDVAIKAFRSGTLPFPDGTIILALHYKDVPSQENNKIFGQEQSFVPGPATNIQLEIKDSRKYAATGGWGFGSFSIDGKPGDDAQMKTCAPCHAKASRDFVFARYAP
jgi:Cytochrome P460